jgi:hydroxypyruvate reductase
MAEPLRPRELLLAMWRAGVAAALPVNCLLGQWPETPRSRLAVIACGKAACGMAAAAAAHFGSRCTGIVIFPESAADPCLAGLRSFPASHPVPGAGSVAAAEAALELARDLEPDDLLMVLLSGGGSALMCLPEPGLALAEKQALSRQLLGRGATIGEINCVRKHLSAIKGGRLAAASAAPVVTLAISDVPGDDPSVIASGPTVPDPSSLADAREVLRRHGIDPAPAIWRALADPANETPKPDGGAAGEFRIVASGMTALRAAAEFCRAQAIEPVVLGDRLQEDARRLAVAHAARALELARNGRPLCLLSGGETHLELGPAPGRGGRNTEYALALALALDGHPGIWALAADTDGIDGHGGHAGALVTPDTLGRARTRGLEPREYLERNDSASLFAALCGLLVEGPTGTNVNDFRAILVSPERPDTAM